MRTAQDIILKPVITEDSMDRLQANRYTYHSSECRKH